MEDTPGNLYKYMGPEIADIFLMQNGTCSLKLSYLKDYNDPFEFFLTIDYDQEPSTLAFYNEMISMVTQQPVTCFSRSPLITPMWAHYASTSQGFVVEIDEIGLANWLDTQPDSFAAFGDIDYQDTPHSHMQVMLDRAHVRSKPRDIGWLRDAINSAAYFTKQECWSYEKERRLVTSNSSATIINDNLSLLYFPSDLVTSVIAGANSSDETRKKLKEISEAIGCNYYEKKFGRSTTTPFFLDSHKNTYTFNEGGIEPSLEKCLDCHEPSRSEKCSWCRITESHEYDAATRNSFRMLHSAGILEAYLEAFNKIGRRK